eukprot:scaffold10683_cov20-Tisochrysis_lutea.AAC.2
MSIASNAPVRVLLVGVIFWGNGVDDLAYLKEFENSDWSAAFSVRKMKIMPYKMYHGKQTMIAPAGMCGKPKNNIEWGAGLEREPQRDLLLGVAE